VGHSNRSRADPNRNRPRCADTLAAVEAAAPDVPAVNPPPGSSMPIWVYGVLVAVVVTALGIAVAFGLARLSGGAEQSAACDGEVDFGYAPNLVEAAAVEPFYQAINGRCQLWFAIDAGGDIAAYQPVIEGRDCRVRWDIESSSWRCGGDEIAERDLVRWPLAVRPVENLDHLFVDFGPAPAPTPED
jgi:hypothetical protein